MKIIYFVRHGKGMPRTEEPDRQRRLSETGKDEAKIIAKRLRQDGMLPEFIVCSPAERAQRTALILAKILRYPPDRIQIREELYDGDQESLLRVIHELDDAYDAVMLIGHNPALSKAANELVRHFDSQIRTSAVLGVHFTNSTWRAVSRESAHLFLYDFPVRLNQKVRQKTQHAIANDIMATMGTLLDPIDHNLPGSLRKTVEKTSHRLAKDVLHVLHTSKLDSLRDREDPEIESEQVDAALE